MRPAWMRCELCFWEEDQWCNYHPDSLETVNSRYCAKWRCQNCEMDWDELEYDEECPEGFVPDHNECIEIQITLEG